MDNQHSPPYADLIQQLQKAAEEDWEMAMPTEIAYEEALHSPDAQEWKAAITKEYNTLVKQNT